MADTEGLPFEVTDAVISCKKEIMVEKVGKAKVELPPEKIIEKRLSAGIVDADCYAENASEAVVKAKELLFCLEFI